MLTYLDENKETLYKELEDKVKYITKEAKKSAEKYGVNVVINSIGSLFTVFFTDKKEINNLKDALSSNTENFAIYFNTMLENGIICPPSQFEAHFVSIAHTQEILDKTLKVIDMAFKTIGEKNEK